MDPYGRYLFLRGTLGRLKCTLANFYAPNHGQVSFLASTLTKLGDFAQGCVLLAGDFNVPLEPTLDTSLGRSCIPHRRLIYIRKMLHEAQLLDVWRIMHPNEKDYTHFSHLHGSHSGIDYLLVNHHYLELLSCSRIEVSTISDHSPISLTLQIPSLPLKSTNWKLNDSLIFEEGNRQEVGAMLSLYF